MQTLNELVPLAQRLSALADLSVPFAVRAAAALGVADHIAAEGSRASDIAEASRVDERALRRLLAALSSKGVCEDLGEDRFALTAAGLLLRSDHPFSLRDVYAAPGLEVSAWCALDYSLRTGKSAFEHLFGRDHGQHRVEHADEDERMDRSHRAASRVEVVTISRIYDWSNVRSVVDLGGGAGAFLGGLLKIFPAMHGTLLELPRLAARAHELLEAQGVAERCTILNGDFFASVPAGGDVYILKAVLGAFTDASAVRFLRVIRAAMQDHAKLLVIEPINQHGPGFTAGNIVHLETLVLYGGPDRSLAEYEQLFASAGLAIARVIQRSTLPIIEVQKITE